MIRLARHGQPPKKRPAHRPSSYTKKAADLVCDLILCGKTVKQIEDTPGCPSQFMIYSWLQKYPEFAVQYARARDESAHAQADMVLVVAEQVRTGRIPSDAGRVAIDALKWSAGKRKPKVYSEKLMLQGDQENPLAVVIGGLKDDLGKKLDRITERQAADRPPSKSQR